jgi:hypothetical protein
MEIKADSDVQAFRHCFSKTKVGHHFHEKCLFRRTSWNMLCIVPTCCHQEMGHNHTDYNFYFYLVLPGSTVCPMPNSDHVWTLSFMHKDMNITVKFISELHFRIWSLIKFSHQMTGRMDLELLQAMADPLIKASNWQWSIKETAPDTVNTQGGSGSSKQSRSITILFA